MHFIFAVIGIIAGYSISEFSGAVFGAVLGFLAAVITKLHEKTQSLSKNLQELNERFSILSKHYEKNQSLFKASQEDTDNTLASELSSEPKMLHGIEDAIEQIDKSATPTPESVIPKSPAPKSINKGKATKVVAPHFENNLNSLPNSPITAKVNSDKAANISETNSSNHSLEPEPATASLNFIQKFLTQGNPIVKVASIVLFFGTAFLLKYAAEQNVFPIEWRFISVAAAAIALFIWSFRLPEKQRKYSLIVQGTALGILYLTTYAASAIYPLLSLNTAFVLLFSLSAIASLMALKQDSSNLVIVAIIGGFLAPILTSSGSNAYVKLFSYYAVINIGILTISIFKSWRHLNWIGFFFTFFIGSFWGFKSYQPQFFNSTEPFLLFHFALYLIIPILFLRENSLNSLSSKGITQKSTTSPLQTGIIFGLPTISFALQLIMVRDFPHGDSWSALGWALSYLVAATVIKKMMAIQLNSINLYHSYLAIGTVFFTSFIFFVFNKDVTSVLWALEAVGLIWLGLRQKQILPRIAGLLILALSVLIFLATNKRAVDSSLFINDTYIPISIISLCAMAIGYFYFRSEKFKSKLMSFEPMLPVALASASALALIVAGFNELQQYFQVSNFLNSNLIYITILSVLLLFTGKLIKWPFLKQLCLILWPAILMTIGTRFLESPTTSPLAISSWPVYPIAIAVSYLLIFSLKDSLNDTIRHGLKTLNSLLIIFLLSWLTASSGYTFDRDWYPLLFGLVPALSLLAIFFYHPKNDVIIKHWKHTQLILIAYLALWFLITMFSQLHPEHISYIPVLNPLDMIHLFIAYLLWKSYQQPWLNEYQLNLATKTTTYVGLFSVFIWLNMILARSFHHGMNIPFNMDSLLSNSLFQVSLSILWSILAVLIMGFSRRQNSRSFWYIGIAILAAILLKLLIFDLSNTGTLTRIVSFLAVGGVMLVIGYFAPMPPKETKDSHS